MKLREGRESLSHKLNSSRIWSRRRNSVLPRVKFTWELWLWVKRWKIRGKCFPFERGAKKCWCCKIVFGVLKIFCNALSSFSVLASILSQSSLISKICLWRLNDGKKHCPNCMNFFCTVYVFLEQGCATQISRRVNFFRNFENPRDKTDILLPIQRAISVKQKHETLGFAGLIKSSCRRIWPVGRML